jgi:hypothetical protein
MGEWGTRYFLVTVFVGGLLSSAIPMGHAEQQAGGRVQSASERARLPFTWDVVRGAYATPGVSLVIKEKGRFRTGNSTTVVYELRAPGFLAKEEPILVQRMMNETYVRTLGVLLDEKAPAFDPKDPTLVHPRNHSIGGYVLGEALDLAFFTPDGSKRAHARVIPFPIEARGTGG